jgi:HEPN domain-containing protein
MNVDNFDVDKWLQYALADYNAAVNMIRFHRPVPIEIVCYHSQQAAEKMLKAFLIAKSEALMKTHDLVALLNQCRKYSADFDKCAKSCVTLTTFATLSRYPSNVEITEQQMKQAINDTRVIMDFLIPFFAEMGHVIKIQEAQREKPLVWLEKAKEKVAEQNSSLHSNPHKKKDTMVE